MSTSASTGILEHLPNRVRQLTLAADNQASPISSEDPSPSLTSAQPQLPPLPKEEKTTTRRDEEKERTPLQKADPKPTAVSQAAQGNEPNPDTVTSWDVEMTAKWVGNFFKDDPQLQQERMCIIKRNRVSGKSAHVIFTSDERLGELIPEIGTRVEIIDAYAQLRGEKPPTKQIPSSERAGTNIKMHQVCQSSREGVALWDTLVSPRTRTCELINGELDKHGAVLIRSPPFSGKTSLAELFLHYLEKHNEPAVRVNFLALCDPSGLDQFWKSEFGGVSWEHHLKSTEALTVILDEAQFIYSLGQGHAFWNAIKLAMNQGSKTTKTRVLVFAAHGEKPDDGISAYAPTPIAFERMLDLKDMMFSYEEYDDIMTRYASTNEGRRLPIGPDAQEAIWNATRGHPGLVRLCLDKVMEKLLPTARMDAGSQGKDYSAMIIEYLMSHDFFIALKGTRACTRQNFTDQEKEHLLKLLNAGDDGISPDGFPMELTTTGLIGFHSGSRIKLAAPLFRGILIQRFYSSPRPPHTTLDFDQFIKATIRGMNPNVLRNSLSRTSIGDPLYERHWQMEFYRSATSLLSSEHTISPDVGRVFGANGLMDFYVDGGLKWGIELLREGDRTQEHATRFKPGGAYYTLMDKHMTNFAILDFRAHGNDKPARNFERNFWYIFYGEDYKKATLKRLNHADEELTISGGVPNS